MNHKKFAVLVATLTISGIGVAAILSNTKTVKNDSTLKTGTVITPQTPISSVATVTPPALPSPIQRGAPTPLLSPTPTPTSTTTPTSAYGEDSNNPGVYKVFDKLTVMTEAGISTDQQSSADTLISRRMNWIYKRDSMPEANICYIAPKIKMATAGADYNDNPVTQLKWCNNFVQSRYGNWGAALTFFSEHGYF